MIPNCPVNNTHSHTHTHTHTHFHTLCHREREREREKWGNVSEICWLGLCYLSTNYCNREYTIKVIAVCKWTFRQRSVGVVQTIT